MSEFVVGLPARDIGVAAALQSAFAAKGTSFAVRDPRAGPVGFAPGGGAQPRHFSPAEPGANPTQGWDPLDPESSGVVDAISAARAAGYAEGFAAANGGRDQGLVENVSAQLSTAHRINREGVALRIRQTVLHLVGRIVGEAGIAPELLAARIDAATGLLADSAESAMLRVNPDDVALLEGKLPANVFAAGDAAIARGSFVLESASTIVEDGPEMWLEQLAQALDRISVPEI